MQQTLSRLAQEVAEMNLMLHRMEAELHVLTDNKNTCVLETNVTALTLPMRSIDDVEKTDEVVRNNEKCRKYLVIENFNFLLVMLKEYVLGKCVASCGWSKCSKTHQKMSGTVVCR